VATSAFGPLRTFRPFRISAFQPYCDIVSSRSEPVSEVMRRDHVAWTASDLLVS
jgi:hypothetical protein